MGKQLYLRMVRCFSVVLTAAAIALLLAPDAGAVVPPPPPPGDCDPGTPIELLDVNLRPKKRGAQCLGNTVYIDMTAEDIDPCPNATTTYPHDSVRFLVSIERLSDAYTQNFDSGLVPSLQIYTLEFTPMVESSYLVTISVDDGALWANDPILANADTFTFDAVSCAPDLALPTSCYEIDEQICTEQVACDVSGGDCNGNQINDQCDILAGISDDCTGDGVPDECESDCNMNGVPDSCDIAGGSSTDCNDNGILDECELRDNPQVMDCNFNGIPDACELETGCSGPGIPSSSCLPALYDLLDVRTLANKTEDLTESEVYSFATVNIREDAWSVPSLARLVVGADCDGVDIPIRENLNNLYEGSVVYARSPLAAGEFWYYGLDDSELSHGVVLSTGNIWDVHRVSCDPTCPEPENVEEYHPSEDGYDDAYTGSSFSPGSNYMSIDGDDLVQLGDEADDLNSYSEYGLCDAATFVFYVKSEQPNSMLYIQYVFASEEYPYFVCEMYNDIFGIFVDGQNVSLFERAGEDIERAVAINSINAGDFYGQPCDVPGVAELYRDNSKANDDSQIRSEMNGMTTLMRAHASLDSSIEWHEVRFVIADAGDPYLDSAVFIPENGLVIGPATGACCDLVTGDCTEWVSEADCAAAGGSWSAGQTCAQYGCHSCEADCNVNGVLDNCEIRDGDSLDVDPRNGVPDECDVAAAIRVYDESGAELAPNGEGEYVVSECDALNLDGSFSRGGFGGTGFAWDVNVPAGGTPDFEAPDAATPEVTRFWGIPELTPLPDTYSYDAWLRVTSGGGITDETSVRIVVVDSEPSAALQGPTLLAAGQDGCFVAAVNHGCDDVTAVGWDFDYDGTTFSADYVGEYPDADGFPGDLAVTTQWSSAGEYVIAFQVVDEDGDAAVASLPVLISEAQPACRSYDDRLVVERRFHAYSDSTIVSSGVRHTMEMRIANIGDVDLTGPFYIAFEGLAPTAGASLTNDLAGTEAPLGETPHVLVQTGSLAHGAATEWVEVQWDIAASVGEAFGFTPVAYAPQQPPVFTTAPIEEATEGVLYSYQAEAEDFDGDPIYFTLSPGTPTGMELSREGLLTWTPSQTAYADVDGNGERDDPATGMYTVVIAAHDGYEYSEQTVEITVNEVNVRPEIASAAVTTAVGGEAYSYTVTIRDPDYLVGDAFLTTKAWGPAALYCTTPTYDDLQDLLPHDAAFDAAWDDPEAGAYWVDLRARDQGGLEARQEFWLDVVSCADRPIIDRSVDTFQAAEGEVFDCQVPLGAGFAGKAYFFLELAPDDNMVVQTVANVAYITWLPSYTSHGNRVFRLLATDDEEGLSDCRDTFAFQIEVADRNARPVITTESLPDAMEGVRYVALVHAEDADGDELTYVLAQYPDGMAIDPRSGRISWAPGHAESATCDVQVRVIDAALEYDERSFTINVAEDNVAPIVITKPVTTAEERNEYYYDIDAFDPDTPDDPVGDLLHYSWCGARPEGMAFDPGGAPGGLVWTPDLGASTAGPHCVAVNVSDDEGKSTAHVFWISVYPPRGPGAEPEITSDPPGFACVGEPYLNADGTDVVIAASDADVEDVLAFEITSDRGAAASIETVGDPAPGRITWTPSAGDLGLHQLRVAVTDGNGNWDHRDFAVYVFDGPHCSGNSPPAWIRPGDASAVHTAEALADATLSFELEVRDPDDEALTWSFVPVHENNDPQAPLRSAPAGLEKLPVAGTDRLQRIAWKPTVDQVGEHWLGVQVSDEYGNSSETAVFRMLVSTRYANHYPDFDLDPPPPPNAVVGELYSYQFAVIDEDVGDSHVFELPTGPAGASVGRDTGLLTWRPTSAQRGFHEFLARTTDRGQLSCELNFWVLVTDTPIENVRPEFLNAPTNCHVKVGATPETYSHTFAATDVDDGPSALTFSKRLTPSGAQLVNHGDGTATLTWTPTTNQIGSHAFEIVVTDPDGASASQEFVVSASNADMNHVPEFISQPALRARVGDVYEYEAWGRDDDAGDALSFSFVTRPFGVSHTGDEAAPTVVQWTPTSEQIGAHQFVLRVTDSFGSSADQPFVVTVSDDGENHAPRITSTPIETASSAPGASYQYPVCAADADSDDELFFDLLTAPLNPPMTVSAEGLIEWNCGGVSPGVYAVTVRVTDSERASDTQSFKIAVSAAGAGHAPRFTTSPVTEVVAGEFYSYAAVASDKDGDGLEYSLLLNPDPPDFSIVPGTGEVTWNTVDPDDVGAYRVSVRAAETAGDFDVVQDYVLTVLPSNSDNRPPQFVTSPPSVVRAGGVYAYQAEAVDPNTGDSVTYAVWMDEATPPGAQAPTVDANGLVNWDTDVWDPGVYRMSLSACDDGVPVMCALDSFDVSVKPNGAPQFTSTPPKRAALGVEYAYQATAYDPDGDTLTYSLALTPTPPTGMTIDGTEGLISGWTPTELESHDVTVLVTDGAAETSQSITIEVVEPSKVDEEFPTLSVELNRDLADVAGVETDPNVTIMVSAADDLGVQDDQATLRVLHDGVVDPTTPVTLSLDENGTASYVYPQAPATLAVGGYEIQVTVADLAGHETTASAGFRAYDSTVGENAGLPIARITNLGDGQIEEHTEPVAVEGRACAYDGEADFWKYELSYRRLDAAMAAVVFESGFSEVGADGTPALLGSLDTTMLKNGLYEITLDVYDRDYGRSSDSRKVLVGGGQKVGNFTLAFADLEVSMAGVPFTVTRAYDSREKRSGDFGFGWSLNLSQVVLQESTLLNEGWGVGTYGFVQRNCIVEPFVDHVVTITWPDDRTESFRLLPGAGGEYPEGAGCCTGESSIEGWNAAPLGDTTSTLEVLGDGPVISLAACEFVTDAESDRPWRPAGYELHTRDGVTLVFGGRHPVSGTSRLTRIVDRQGAEIIISDDGVEHSSGKSITFSRDSVGRIWRVTDPDGRAVDYEYDDRGDLVAVTDCDSSITTFRYNNEHGLLEIIDPRGVRAVKNIYDDQGRIIEHIDANGARVTYAYDLDGQTQTVVDRLGHETTYHYNADGNITRKREKIAENEYESTWYDYDADGKLTATYLPYPNADPADLTTAAGNYATTRVYKDGTDLVASEQSYEGGPTQYEYNDFGQVTDVTDALGNTTHYVYNDTTGVLESVKDAEQNVSEYVYEDGKLVATYLTVGDDEIITLMDYDADGRVTLQTDALGNETTYGYDAVGNLELTSRSCTAINAEGIEVAETIGSHSEYDDAGRVTRQYTTLSSTNDTRHGEVVTTYNAIGKAETVTDSTGVTSYEYDAVGNLARVTYPDETYEEYGYDAEGRRLWTRSRDGAYTWQDYDELGRVVRSYYPDYSAEQPTDVSGRPHSERAYDSLGRVTTETDEFGDQTTEYFYPTESYDGVNTLADGERAVKRIAEFDGAPTDVILTRSVYDDAGNLVVSYDGRGNATSYEYDKNNRLVKTSWTAGGALRETTSEYDAAGREVKRVDPDQKVTEFVYDVAGRLLKVIDDDGRETVYDYDESGAVTSQTDANQHTTTMAYDGLGRLRKRTLPDGVSTEEFTYDAVGDLAEHVNFAGDATTFDYDAVTREMTAKTLPATQFSTSVSYQGFSAFFDLRWEIDPVTFDDYVTITTRHNGTPAPTAIAIVDNYTTQPLFSFTDLTDEGVNGPWTLTASDVEALLAGLASVRVVGADAVERYSPPIAAVSPLVEYGYSVAGQTVEAGGRYSGAWYLGDEYAYDIRGRLAETALLTGDSFTFEHDFDRDQEPRAVRTTLDLNAVNAPQLETVRRYDSLGRLREVDGPHGLTKYEYDAAGNRSFVLYPFDAGAMYEYDEHNRLTTIVNFRNYDPVPDPPTYDPISTFEYRLGPAGNRTHATETFHTDGVVREIEYVYDNIYRLTDEIAYTGEMQGGEFVLNYERSISYVYDAVGNRRSMTVYEKDHANLGVETGYTVTYDYDANDCLLRETRVDEPYAAALRTDPHAIYARAKHPLPTPSKHAPAGAVSFFVVTALLSVAPLLLVARAGGGRRARRRRLLHATVAMFFIPQFMVGLENLVGLNTEALERVALAQAVGGSTETTYEYDANGNVTSRSISVDGALPTTETYVYDSQSRLVRYEPADATPAEIVGYTYDDAGIRTSKTVGGVTTWYVTDASQGLAQVAAELTHDGGSDHGFGLYHMLLAREVQATYAYGDDLISRRTGVTGDIAYYHYDGQMSTRQLTKSTVVTNVYSYDAFGGELEHASLPTPEYAPYAAPNAYRYTGEQFDDPTGLYYLRARYYDPGNGRFTGRDPWSGNMSEPGTLHKYAYCAADPVNKWDPSGMFFGGVLNMAVVSFWNLQVRFSEAAPKLQAYAWVVMKMAGMFWIVGNLHQGLERLGWVPESEADDVLIATSEFIFFSGFIAMGLLSLAPAPPTRGQVAYGGTDLSRQAQAIRVDQNIRGGRNVAIFEYTKNGQVRTIPAVSQRGCAHAERQCAAQLQRLGVSPSSVRRIYSELEPCGEGVVGGNCAGMLQREFPQAIVTWSFDYGATAESRRQGVESLKEAVNKMFDMQLLLFN